MKRLKTYKLNFPSRAWLPSRQEGTEGGVVILRKPSLFSFIFILTANIVLSQTFSVETNKDSITIGDPITLILKLKTPQKKTYIWPTFFKGDSLPDAFEVLEVFEKQKSNNNKGLTTQQLTITSFEPGNHTLDPFVLQDTTGVLTSSPLTINVVLFPTDTTADIRDIKPIKEVSLTFKDKWYRFLSWVKSNWYWVLLGVLLIGFLTWFLFIKKKHKQQPVNKEVPKTKEKILPAHIKALQHLKEIEKEKPWESGDFKIYSIRLTDVMRDYIHGRYRISTKEKTSSQILSELDSKTISESLKEKLRGLLTLSDLVKFAKQEPTNDQSQEILNDAIDFVKQTTPKHE